MGGDIGPRVVLPAALRVLNKRKDLNIILVGPEDTLGDMLGKAGQRTFDENRLAIHHASQQVEMHDSAAVALRMKKDSSMRVAINLVKEGKADACVSAGNTGALMATARFVLKTIPGIDRPAICTSVPSITGLTYVLDLGANVDCTAEHLFQFAVMGGELVTALEHVARPRIGVLNIGEEELKGNERVKDAAALISNSALNYIGFVEGNDIYMGGSDVVVCDGFVGNVALKTSEGVAKMISQFIKQEFTRNWFHRLAGVLSIPVMKGLRARIDPRNYNGASLLGLRKIVVKSHGSADETAFANAIEVAMLEAEEDVPSRIGSRVSGHLEKGEVT